MISNFLRSILSEKPDTISTEESHVALAALLVRIARSDSKYEKSEIETIKHVLIQQYEMSEDKAISTIEKAEELEAEAPDTVRFTRALKNTIPYENRKKVIEGLWQVALADGARDSEEDAIIRLAAQLLGVTDVESAVARQSAQDSPKTE